MLVLGVSSAKAFDSDADGMSDVWQQEYQIGTNDRNSDLDTDDFPNWVEEQFGTDPNSSSSMPPEPNVIETTDIDGVRFPKVEWYGVVGIKYEVYRSIDLVSWELLSLPLYGGGYTMSFEPLSTEKISFDDEPLQFFRLKASHAEDADGDQLDGWEEGHLGTINGYDEDFILRYDTDGDGLNDLVEWQLGLNPLSVDTDGDGTGDTAEIAFAANGLNPNDPSDLGTPATSPGSPGSLFVSAAGENEAVTDNEDVTIPKGSAWLAVATVTSSEYSEWTEQESEYNDEFSAKVEYNGATLFKDAEQGVNSVNSFHSDFFDGGGALTRVLGVVHIEGDPATMAEVTLEATVTNIGDEKKPTQVFLELRPLDPKEVHFAGDKYFQLKKDDLSVNAFRERKE